MANNVQVEGDPNTADGLIQTPLQSFVNALGKLISVNGSPVSPDEITEDVHTANGSSFVNINGIPVNLFGNADTDGATRAGTQVTFITISN